MGFETAGVGLRSALEKPARYTPMYLKWFSDHLPAYMWQFNRYGSATRSPRKGGFRETSVTKPKN